MKKVLVIGPSATRAMGGMSSVIADIGNSGRLNDEFDITLYESFIDGSLITRTAFTLYAFMRFLLVFHRYDLFHLNFVGQGSMMRARYYAFWLSLFRKKMIFHIHISKMDTFYEKLSPKGKRNVRKLLRKPEMIIVLSDYWRKKFKKITDSDRIMVLNNAVLTDIYREAISDVSSRTSELLFLGRIGDRKGAYDLVHAIRELRNRGIRVHCTIAGDGEVEKLRHMVHGYHLEDRITVPGWCGLDDKISYLKQAGVVVLPSYNEGMPMAILEGMAAGKVIISTDVGSIPEVVVDRENGRVVRPGDVEALADAIAYYVAHPEETVQIATRNRLKIESTYDVNRMHELLAEYYRQVLTG